VRLDDLKNHVRMLVVEYAVSGKDALTEMSEADRRLLLSEKQIQLARVSACYAKTGGPAPDTTLKVMLECDVKEIGESLGRGHSRGR
jgi:hypothetical protein